MKKILFIFTLAFITTSVNANSLLIKNVDVYKSNGMEPNTNVLIKNGEIVAIGKRIYETADRDIDGTGKSLTPGLFNSHTHIGAVEVSAIGPTVDYYSDNDSVTAALKIAEAFNPNSTLIPHNRTHGLSHALMIPESSTHLFSGQVALVQLGLNPRVIHEIGRAHV